MANDDFPGWHGTTIIGVRKEILVLSMEVSTESLFFSRRYCFLEQKVETIIGFVQEMCVCSSNYLRNHQFPYGHMCFSMTWSTKSLVSFCPILHSFIPCICYTGGLKTVVISAGYSIPVQSCTFHS